ERKLSVRPENRQKSTILVPPRIQLAPFFAIGSGGLVKPPLYEEAAHIHRPVGTTRHRKIDTRSYLIFHIVPPRRDIAAPSSSRIPLLAGKERAGKDKHPVVRIGLSLTFVNAPGIFQWERIVVPGRRT